MRKKALATIAVLAGISPAHAFSAKFSWAGISACGRTSPAFQMSAVPSGTAKLRFRMTDLNKPDFPHGGSTVDYKGGAVAKGAISYTGPCPPGGEKHTYRWTVEALDAAGKTLATTSASASFPP